MGAKEVTARLGENKERTKDKRCIRSTRRSTQTLASYILHDMLGTSSAASDQGGRKKKAVRLQLLRVSGQPKHADEMPVCGLHLVRSRRVGESFRLGTVRGFLVGAYV